MLVLDRLRGNAHKAGMIARLIALLMLACVPAGSALAQAETALSPLQQADRRLAVIAERLQGSNAFLCRQLMPLTGLILHSSDQYGRPPPALFANGPAAVAHVLPGSPAERAEVAANDGLVAIDDTPIAGLVPESGHPMRDSVFGLLAGHDPSAPLGLTLRRQGRDSAVQVTAPPGCRALVEVLTDRTDTSRSDGRVIQVSQDLIAGWSDNELAAIFAHELAHAVLEHRRRLAAAGVETGFLGEFGRNRRLRRLVEEEADRLSVHLLANAGFDPAIAPQFWLSETGRRMDAGILRSGAYPSRSERAARMEREIAAHLAGVSLPSSAPHLLAGRDLPFLAR